MEEQLAFERRSHKQLAADILQYVLREHGLNWRWSLTRDEFLPRNLPYLYRVITFEMTRIGNTLDQLKEVVFDKDRSMVKVLPLWTLIDAMFYHRSCGRGFSQVIVACAIVGQLSLFFCRIKKYWLVDELVEILWRVFSERVGDNLPALERFARGKLGVMRIPEAA